MNRFLVGLEVDSIGWTEAQKDFPNVGRNEFVCRGVEFGFSELVSEIINNTLVFKGETVKHGPVFYNQGMKSGTGLLGNVSDEKDGSVH